MNSQRRMPTKNPEKGVALLIALFVMILVSVVALSLLLSSGTESAIAGNYRLAMQSYYAANAGLEEARGRMWSQGANAIPAALLPSPMPVGTALYIVNPLGGEVVAPTNAGNAYYDNEYVSEFGVQASTLGAAAQTTPSVSPVAGFPGPLYKWVRITPKTEQSENLDIDNDGDINAALPIYYNGVHQFVLGAAATNNLPAKYPNDPSTQHQVYRLTSLAVLPNGAKRMLQEDVAMLSFNLNFPSALTLVGPTPSYATAKSANYAITGVDQSPGPAGGCPPKAASVPGIGVDNNVDAGTVAGDLKRPANYTGSTPAPSVNAVNLPLNEQTPAQLETLVLQIEAMANYVVQGPVASLPSYGTAAAPVVVVVDSPNNGATANLSLGGNITGYGVLVVRGTYSAGGNVGWNGVVLVIGQGVFSGNGGGNNSYNGAVFVANTRDAAGNLLPNFGIAGYNFSGGGGNGINFNSCSINNAFNSQSYRALSFHEVAQ